MGTAGPACRDRHQVAIVLAEHRPLPRCLTWMVSALNYRLPDGRLGAWPHAPPRLPRGGATYSHPGCAASGAVFGLDPSEHGRPFEPRLWTLFGTPMRRLVFKAAEDRDAAEQDPPPHRHDDLRPTEGGHDVHVGTVRGKLRLTKIQRHAAEERGQ